MERFGVLARCSRPARHLALVAAAAPPRRAPAGGQEEAGPGRGAKRRSARGR